MKQETEVWKDIDGFPGYQVSSVGRVRCFRDFHGNITEQYRLLKPILNKDNYYYVDLYTIEHKQVHKRIHRLVADTFIGSHPDLVVNHIDGNKHNNNVDNIEFVTAKRNSTLASEQGLYKTRPIRIVETGEEFNSVKQCAEAIGCHSSDINHVISGIKKHAKGYTFEYIDSIKSVPLLYGYQMDAVKKMFDGCILNGGVGSGKSRTGLYYYFSQYGGSKNPDYVPMKNPADLYIITTAKKRDTLEWEGELTPFLLSPDTNFNKYNNNVVIDSWNNIQKYISVENAFFIFDEDRVTGYGAWVKAFLKITKNNRWIILSATAGDTWMDYVAVFIANGFYKNKSDFIDQHVVYSRFTKYPKVERYLNTGKLLKYRNKILIPMSHQRHTIRHNEDVFVQYDTTAYKEIGRTRWNPYTNKPIKNASELCLTWRKLVNTDESRQTALLEIFERHPKIIVFYNFDYELDILKKLYYGENVEVAEWNGHKHELIPESESWVYLVQYTAGCEGWNAITTNTIVFFSQTYSYKMLEQSRGRIDRVNTPYIDLYYYHLKTRSSIDLGISRSLKNKKDFNERDYVGNRFD